MKPNLTRLVTPLLLALALGLAALPARAQVDTNTVTISAAEFQRMVYSGALLTSFFEKPELDASLRVLLELHRRNPQTDPTALAGLLLTNALPRYRTNAPAYIRTSGWQDEMLAAYLDALRQVPKPANFVPANLTLLNILMTRRNVDTNSWQAPIIHSGTQRLFTYEDDLAQRQDLVDTATRRAWENPAFATAMDALLFTETGASLTWTPAQIINSSAALSNNATMQALLALSTAGGSGSITVTAVALNGHFTSEMQAMHQTIVSNRAVHLEINDRQGDTVAYLAKTNAIAADAALEDLVKATQQKRIAAANSAVYCISKAVSFMPGNDTTGVPWVKRATQLTKVGGGVIKVAEALLDWKQAKGFAKLAASGNVVGAALAVFSLFGPDEPDPNQAVLDAIGDLKTDIKELRVEMNQRFDEVDNKLNIILDTLNTQFTNINLQLGTISGNVNTIRAELVNVQNQLHRIERNLQTFFAETVRLTFRRDLDDHLRYELRTGELMVYNVPGGGTDTYLNAEGDYYGYAVREANSEILSPVATRSLDPKNLYAQLTFGTNESLQVWSQAQNLNYIKSYLRTLPSLNAFNSDVLDPLANPQDWNGGASAWMQLAIENPMHFRLYPSAVPRLNDVMSMGEDLTTFFTDLTFTGSGASRRVNTNLYDALLGYYSGKLNAFNTQVHATEQQFGTANHFAVDAWRQWASAPARVNAVATEVRAAQADPPPRGTARIAAGRLHSLALQSDGSVAAWGDNGRGQTNVPPGLSGVLAIAGGANHSLALKSDGSVVAWGDNGLGQTNVPPGLSGVVAIAGGAYHSLALKSDGSVVSWGGNFEGQTNVPPDLSGVVAIAGGFAHSLALKSDGSMVAWGDNSLGQTNVPPGLSGVVAIAGGAYHSLALKSDGSVVAWGVNGQGGQTNVPPGLSGVVAIAGGAYHSLALKSNGSVVAWGENFEAQTNVPFGLSGVVAIAAGYWHSLALKSDGSMVAWGYNSHGQIAVPVALNWRVAIVAGGNHDLARKADGTLVAWGDNSSGQTAIPDSATNVVAMSAGTRHGLAVKADGTVVGWGTSDCSQRVIPANLPANIVAVAAGDHHSLALGANGRIFGWGCNGNGEVDGFPNASASGFVISLECGLDAGQILQNVVAIAAGNSHSLALRADGWVVGWGYDQNGALGTNRCSTGFPVPTFNAAQYVWLPCSVSPGSPCGAEPLIGVVAIAAGGSHSLALKANRMVVAFGANAYGQSTIPGGLADVVAIAAGENHSVALKSDGTVIAWGANTYGQSRVPAGLANVVAISAGGNHTVALLADSTIIAWGDRDTGQPTIPGGRTNVVAVAAGVAHLPGERPPRLALLADGTVAGWGINWGPFDLARQGSSTYTSAVSTGASNQVGSRLAVAFSSAGSTRYARDSVVSTATDNFGIEAWVKPSTVSGIQAIAYNGNAGSSGWGLYQRNGIYQGVFGGVSFVGSGPVTAGEWTHLALVRSSGMATLYVNGVASGPSPIAPRPPAGGFGLGANLANPTFEFLDGALDEVRVFTFTSGQFVPANLLTGAASSAVNTVGHWRLGEDDAGAISGAIGNATTAGQRAVGMASVKAIAAGAGHALALRSNGTVVAWGNNVYGNVPPGLANVAAIAAGAYHSLALQSDGTVIGWGDNAYGQAATPSELSSAQVVAIAAGTGYSLALNDDGTVFGWGYSRDGQANGTTNLSSPFNSSGLVRLPGTVADLNNVVAIAAGARHSLALKSDGTVVGWGDNTNGQTTIPTGLSDVVAISAGARHSLALRSDGTVIGWGDNSQGQLNNLDGLTDVVAISAGEWFSLFVRGSSMSGSGQPLSFVQAQIPSRVATLLRCANTNVVDELGRAGALQSGAIELSGGKALLTAVLELGLPYTLERDDILHGFLYGSVSLADLDVSRHFLAAENDRLLAQPNTPAVLLSDVANARFGAFTNRLRERLGDLAASGQPEIPRLVGHTLRLLNLLRDAYTPAPPSALEISRQPTHSVRLALYGEPYARYTLQESINAWTTPGTPVWTPVSGIINLRSIDSPIGMISTNLPINTTTPVHYYRPGPSAP